MKAHAKELQEQYNQIKGIAKSQISEIMVALSEGKVPDQASIDSLEASLSELRKKDREISILTWDDPDLPRKRREIAKILLKRFAGIQSPVKGYAKALAPYKRQALELLPSVDNYTELLEIEGLTTGPRFFFKALEIIENHPDLSYDLKKALSEFYPERVLLGIVGGKYYVPTEDTDAAQAENRELEELGYDPSFVIKDDVLMEYANEDPDEIVVIPPWIRRIDGLAFRYCRGVNRIIIPDSVQEFSYYAFHNAGIVSVVIPDSVTKMGGEDFSGCSYLKSVVVGKGITEIGDRSFESCQRLEHLELPATLKRVGYYAFEKCYSLKTVWVDGIEYRISDPDAPKPVRMVFDCLEEIRDRIQSDYDNGLMDEFEYVDYNIAGDGYSY